MKVTNKHFVILFVIALLVIIAGITIFGRPAEAQYILKGDPQYISQPRTSGASRTTTVAPSPNSAPTKTTGYVNGQYINLKTVPQADGSTVTSGYVDGQYVRVKTRKD